MRGARFSAGRDHRAALASLDPEEGTSFTDRRVLPAPSLGGDCAWTGELVSALSRCEDGAGGAGLLWAASASWPVPVGAIGCCSSVGEGQYCMICFRGESRENNVVFLRGIEFSCQYEATQGSRASQRVLT